MIKVNIKRSQTKKAKKVATRNISATELNILYNLERNQIAQCLDK